MNRAAEQLPLSSIETLETDRNLSVLAAIETTSRSLITDDYRYRSICCCSTDTGLIVIDYTVDVVD